MIFIIFLIFKTTSHKRDRQADSRFLFGSFIEKRARQRPTAVCWAKSILELRDGSGSGSGSDG